MSQEPVAVVVFRTYPNGEVLALFPYIAHTHYLCACYAHVGQHSGADYNACIAQTRPATPDEYRALRRELESEPYNYRLKVAQRRQDYATYRLVWSPEGKEIARVDARNARAAIRKAPKPYRKYLGEIYAERVS